MAELIELQSADGHRLEAWLATPKGRPKGGVVVIQEIFGVTEQMKRCTDRYAEAGYLAVLPAMFDRKERGLRLGYADFQKGGMLAHGLAEDQVLADVEAARQRVASAGRTAIVGFCWGGTVAYLAASQLPFACAASYYGGGVARLAERMKPKVPVIYHFGAKDHYIPAATIGKVQAVDTAGTFHVYEGADHGFGCDDRDGYNPEASRLADERTLAFFAQHLGG